MFVSFVCCVGSGLCDELITRPEDSYRCGVSNVCDVGTSRMRRPRPELGYYVTARIVLGLFCCTLECLCDFEQVRCVETLHCNQHVGSG
jgi:hypothetical protein